jgi:hypothetical protein
MMDRMKIESVSKDPHRPYAHLVPIVDALVRDGNVPVDGETFYLDRDGWRCDLAKPINFELVEQMFDLPESILLSRANDAILCQNSWIEIKGNVSASAAFR